MTTDAIVPLPATTPARGSAGTRRWDHDLPPARGLALRLLIVGVFLMPAQLEIDAFRSVVDTRLPPGDFALALSILVLPTSLRLRRRPLALLPLAMIATLAWGSVVALLYGGQLTMHSIAVKLLGAVVLAIWCLVIIHHVRHGHGPRLLRAWLLGMFWLGVIAYLEWKFVDGIPFVTSWGETRYAGVQNDPNNAGAAYAVAVVLMWQYGARLFPNRLLRFVVGGFFLVALTQTFSRGGYIGLGGAVVAVVLIRRGDMRTWARYTMVGLVIATAAVATGIVGDSISEWQNRPDTVGARDALLDEGIEGFVDSYGLGIGLGTFRAQNDMIVHNTAMWLLMEMSFVGVALFGAMIAVPFMAARRLRAVDPDYAYALIGAHVVMVITSVGIEALYQRHWWLIVALCAAPVVPVGTGSRERSTPTVAQTVGPMP